uniref:CCHC-type domain-containing protein n=1 Tax=Hyaloperonospora arabidopsidis (strain Emoy2) TaxID=559515 RepID=M4B3E7_HYAAE
MVLLLVAAQSRRLCRPASARCVLSLLCYHVQSSLPHSQYRQSSKLRIVSMLDDLPIDNQKLDTNSPLIEKEEVLVEKNSSPLERLLQHSEHFQFDVDDVSYDEDDDDVDVVDSNGPDEVVAGFNGYTKGSSTSRWLSDARKRNSRRRRYGNAELGRNAVDHIVDKDTDEIDYDAELENVWDEQERKQRKFYQTLRRDYDRNHVCTNCGERGHQARNCLVPPICSNCGNLGHTARQCRYTRNPDTMDEFLVQGDDIHAQKKKNRKVRKKAVEFVNNPGMPRPKEVPMSHFYSRNEELRKELDAELDAYADVLEKQARKRRARKVEKDAAAMSVSEK